MNRTGILEALDMEIARLQQARALLADSLDFVPAPVRKGPGRPKGSGKAKPAPAAPATKRKMSAEGRARIVAAQKSRWAKLHAAAETSKKAAVPKSAKKSSTKAAKKAAKKTGTGLPSAKSAGRSSAAASA